MIKYTCGAGTPEEAEANCTSFINGECTASWCEYRRKKQTNADHIRAMSDEELAKAIAGSDWCEYCDQIRENGICHAMEFDGPLNQYCIAGCLKWLQKEAEEVFGRGNNG